MLSRLASQRILLSGRRLFAVPANPNAATQTEDDTYTYLPSGSSVSDPTYGLEDTTVLRYDDQGDEIADAPSKLKKRTPPTPMNLAAAQKKLKEKNDREEEPYVYLPPGCSIRDPTYGSRLSDPQDKVFYRDPSPTLRKK